MILRFAPLALFACIAVVSIIVLMRGAKAPPAALWQALIAAAVFWIVLETYLD